MWRDQTLTEHNNNLLDKMAKSNDASHLSPDRRASKRQKLSINFFTRVRNLITSHVSFTNTVSKHSATDIVDDSIATDDTAAAETMAAATAAEVSTPSLAPEIWAHVCDFLPYQSLLQTAVVSREMLVDVMPRVTMLHIDKSCQLHAGVTHRYGDLQDIYIYSLIEFEDDLESYDCHLDDDTLTRALPFLCNFSSCLERVFLGGRRPSNGQVEGYKTDRFSVEDDMKMNNFIDLFSGAFRAGALPNNVWIAGLSCSKETRMHINTCKVCRNACKSFPLSSVVDFEDIHVIRERYRFRAKLFDDDIFGLNVCLKRTEIEEIILGRPGGKELLQSKTRFMTLLGRGVRHVVITDDDKVLYVVKYDDAVLGQINRFIKHSSMDVTMVPPDEVTEALRRSFAADERDPLPPREQCYLAESSFNALKELGLPIEETDFLNEDELCYGYKNSYFSCDWRFY